MPGINELLFTKCNTKIYIFFCQHLLYVCVDRKALQGTFLEIYCCTMFRIASALIKDEYEVAIVNFFLAGCLFFLISCKLWYQITSHVCIHTEINIHIKPIQIFFQNSNEIYPFHYSAFGNLQMRIHHVYCLKMISMICWQQ